MVKQLKVLVTGGAGFIGSHLVDRLIESGHQVVVVDNLSKGNCIFVHPKAQFILEDITAPRLGGIFKLEQPEVVFHEAAQIDVQTSVRKPQADAQVNIQGTINVLEACINSGVKKVIYASSAAAYGNPQYLGIDEQHPIDPLSPYGISKHTAEHYLKVYHQLHGLKYTVLRYANVYGPRQDIQGEGGVVSIFINKLLRNQSLTIDGSGEQTRDFIYVHDVVRANLASLDYGDNQIVNVGTGVKTCKYFVTGNNDYTRQVSMPKLEAALRQAGVTILHNRSVKIQRGNSHVWLVGVDDPNKGRDDLQRALQGTDDAPKVLLAHSPEIIYKAAAEQIDLVLAGHTHGGQVRIPGISQNPAMKAKVELFIVRANDWINQWYAPQVKLPKVSTVLTYNMKSGFEQFISGLYQVQNTQMYVNRGLGETRVPFRLFAPPEITVIELVAEGTKR